MSDIQPDTERFIVTVWDWEGNVVRVVRDATIDEAEGIQDEYADDPMVSVVVEEA